MQPRRLREAQRMTRMLRGRRVKIIRRHRNKEVLIEFVDGTKLFVDWVASGELEFSVTAVSLPPVPRKIVRRRGL
jgi:hypothetical protein